MLVVAPRAYSGLHADALLKQLSGANSEANVDLAEPRREASPPYPD
jgi:hypothetical protein